MAIQCHSHRFAFKRQLCRFVVAEIIIENLCARFEVHQSHYAISWAAAQVGRHSVCWWRTGCELVLRDWMGKRSMTPGHGQYRTQVTRKIFHRRLRDIEQFDYKNLSRKIHFPTCAFRWHFSFACCCCCCCYWFRGKITGKGWFEAINKKPSTERTTRIMATSY